MTKWNLKELATAEVVEVKVKVHLDLNSHVDPDIRKYKHYDVFATFVVDKDGDLRYRTRTTVGFCQEGLEEEIDLIVKELAIAEAKKMMEL